MVAADDSKEQTFAVGRDAQEQDHRPQGLSPLFLSALLVLWLSLSQDLPCKGATSACGLIERDAKRLVTGNERSDFLVVYLNVLIGALPSLRQAAAGEVDCIDADFQNIAVY